MQKFGAGKGAAANLGRLENGGFESPTERRVRQIAQALSSFANDSGVEQDRLLKELMSAAGFGGITEASQLHYLRRKARTRLESSPDLKPHEIDTILDHISVPTMKQIVETPNDERIGIIDLRNIASELRTKAAPQGEEAKTDDSGRTVIAAGRASIHVTGSLTVQQEQLLRNAAALIRDGLD